MLGFIETFFYPASYWLCDFDMYQIDIFQGIWIGQYLF